MGDARALTRSQRPGRVRGRRVRGWARRRGCTSAPPLASEPRGGFPATVPMSACEEQSSPGTPIWVLHELRVSALPEMIRGSWKGKGKRWVLAVWKQTWFIIRFSILCAPPPPHFFWNRAAWTGIEWGSSVVLGWTGGGTLVSGMAGPPEGTEEKDVATNPGPNSCPNSRGVQLWPTGGH